MSARQRKRREKTKRRREKVLWIAEALPTPEGFIKRAQTYDFNTKFAIALERTSDGRRQAILNVPAPRWKHMEDTPQQMMGRLLAWFEAYPEPPLE